MKPEERQERFLARLRALQKEWRVDEIAQSLNVSPLTVRRDLDALAKKGVILRTHGGCVYAGRMALDSAYHRRVATNFDLKEAIGILAAKEVRPGDRIMIDDGSTCFHLASHLDGVGRVTVFANSIAMIPELVRFPEVRLFIIGGEYRSDSFSMGGSLMENALEGLRFDTVFLGADAVDSQGRCLTSDPGTARMSKLVMKRARRKILLADHTKVGNGGHVVSCSLGEFDMWITTSGLKAADRRRYSRLTDITTGKV